MFGLLSKHVYKPLLRIILTNIVCIIFVVAVILLFTSVCILLPILFIFHLFFMLYTGETNVKDIIDSIVDCLMWKRRLFCSICGGTNIKSSHGGHCLLKCTTCNTDLFCGLSNATNVPITNFF